MSDIFLSYSKQDRKRVAPLHAALEELGWTVFWDKEIHGGQNWRDRIESELEAARCVVVVWSENSIRSDFVLDEAGAAKERGVLVPILIDDVDIPKGHGQVQAIPFFDATAADESLEQLRGSIAATIGSTVHEGELDPKVGRALAAGLRGPKRNTILVTVAVVAILVVAGGLAWRSVGDRNQTGSTEAATAAATGVKVLAPTRYGLLGGGHQNNPHEKLLLAFVIHNDGGEFRHVQRVDLTLEDAESNCFEFLAVGRFDELTDEMNVGEALSDSEFGYSLFNSLPLAKDEYRQLNLLFFFEQACPDGAAIDRFRFEPRMRYRGQVHVQLQEGRFDSPFFEFEVRGYVTNQRIITFSNVKPSSVPSEGS